MINKMLDIQKLCVLQKCVFSYMLLCFVECCCICEMSLCVWKLCVLLNFVGF